LITIRANKRAREGDGLSRLLRRVARAASLSANLGARLRGPQSLNGERYAKTNEIFALWIATYPDNPYFVIFREIV
jgi:hypothetical protein